MTINGKSSKVIVTLPFSDILETVKDKINNLKYHYLSEISSTKFITI